MAHDVYVCYDEKDMDVCNEICHLFEENHISYWVKSKDFSSDDSVDAITNAIADSKCFLLIFSKNSKTKNYVITETDIAFSRNVPIVAFNIDGSKAGGNLEFILENQTKISSFPDSKKQLKTLIGEISKIIDRPVGNVKIDSKSVGAFEKVNPNRRQNSIKKYIKIAVPVVIALIIIYFVFILPAGQHTTGDGVFSMNVTDVAVDGLKYTVYGESYNMPADSAKYVMNVKFLDSEDYLVFEVNSTADEFKSGVIWAGNLPDNNITHVEFQLTDMGGNVLSEENYVIK